MNLTEKPEVVTWPETLYAYVEKVGPFQKTAAEAWQELGKLMPALPSQGGGPTRFSLYKVGPRIYRAAVSLGALPANLPKGVKCEKFKGGKYSRFTLKGPWSDLGPASARVFEIVKETNLKQRDDFCIEHYLTDPMTTPPDQHITEILVPTA